MIIGIIYLEVLAWSAVYPLIRFVIFPLLFCPYFILPKKSFAFRQIELFLEILINSLPVKDYRSFQLDSHHKLCHTDLIYVFLTMTQF